MDIEKKLDELLIINVQTAKNNSWLPMSELNRDRWQRYKLDFDFHFTDPDRVGVTLTAHQLGTDCQDREDLAHGMVTVHDPEGKVVLTASTDDYADLVHELVASGKAVAVGSHTERYQDFPGEEVERFNWQKLDVTDLYRQYLQLRNQQYRYTPLMDIRISKQGHGYRSDLLTCLLGGVVKLQSDRADFSHLQHLSTWSDYAFLLQDAAHRTFAPEVQNFKEAMTRVTNIGYFVGRDGNRMRCRIDGQQQISVPVDEETMDRCLRSFDSRLAGKAVASILYAQELGYNRLYKGLHI